MFHSLWLRDDEAGRWLVKQGASVSSEEVGAQARRLRRRNGPAAAIRRAHPIYGRGREASMIWQLQRRKRLMTDYISLLSDLIRQARTTGADAADAVLINGTSLSVSSRHGKIEHLERSEGHDLGLRVFVGKRASIVSSSSLDPAHFSDLAQRAVAMARVVPEDPFTGLADTWAPPEEFDLDMADPAEPSPDDLTSRAIAAEDAAF